MPGNPTFEVVKRYKDWLETQTPNMPQTTPTRPVPVYYSHPGDSWAGNAMIWFGEIEDDYEVHSLRASVRRRKVSVTFTIYVEVFLLGPTEGGLLQYECDTFAQSLRSIIDLDIATEEHLRCPDLIDAAQIVSTRTDRGLTAQGAGSRIAIRVAFDTRFID